MKQQQGKTWLILQYVDTEGKVHHHDRPREGLVKLYGLEKVVVSALFPAPCESLTDVQWFVGISDQPYGLPLRVSPMANKLTTCVKNNINASITLHISHIDGVRMAK